MAKTKINYKCTNCGYISFKWIGCCPTCSQWNSFVEKHPEAVAGFVSKNISNKPVKNIRLSRLDSIKTQKQNKMISGVEEWDRVVGNGILPGAFLILTGDPGIGKSTLLLEIVDRISKKHKVIYFSSEESLQQVKNRAERLGIKDNPNLLFSDQACLENILQIGRDEKPDLLVLDSIQNCHLSDQSQAIPGTIGQLREAGFHLMKLAKENNIAICVTGHITKDGAIAGPKILEHMVDGVFYLKGEDRWHTRILRSVKNRFGTINEMGFFQMGEKGLQQVPDINKAILNEVSNNPGSALICSLEGSRPILVELQALCVTTKFAMPQRVITGIDPKRVILIAAILEKYLHIKLSSQDVFFKVSGGFKIKESAADLGIALSLLSSYFQKPLPEKTLSFAEISLTGKIKPINQSEMRLREAEKFGLENIFISKAQKVKTSSNVFKFSNVYELLRLFPE